MDQEGKHSIALLRKAKRALETSDFSGAIEVCLQASAEGADALECSLLLGYAYLGGKMLNQASKAFRKARDALEALSEDRGRYLSSPMIADIPIQNPSSTTSAGPLNLENSSTLAYSVWLGLFEVSKMQDDLFGQIEGLEQLIQILSEEDPRDSAFRVHLAKNYSLVGEFEKSVQQFRHALESLPVGSEERLETLCSAADVLIQNDAKTAEVEVEAELDTKGREDPGRSVSCIKLDVLAAHAAHDEEKDGNLSINHVLLEIVESAPAALRYLPYREEYLQRCLLKIFHHPPRSTERQQLRLAALKECVGVICNGGPCSCLAYEAAVWLLEEEEEITGGQVSVGGQEVGGMRGLAGGVQVGAEGHIGLGRQATVAFAVENFSRRMFHQFPTNATAQVLLTLMLRRHAYLSKHPVPQLERRKWEELLENAMLDDVDVDCASGFKALAELHYENRNYQKAHDASLRGLRWLQQRRDRGHEALTQVGLGLRLVLAKSLRRLDRLDEAERQFKALAGWVSEGEIAFAEMCGSAPTSIHQQALRGIALVAVARGDHDAALSQYERILGKAALGRGPAEHWAHADYGWLLFKDGDLEHAKSHLEQAVEVSEEEGCSATDSQVGEHRYRLGEVYWSMGGKYQTNKQFSYSMFLEASKVEGHAQASALASLGRYYDVIENNHSIAQRCYKKALDIDPSTKIAGKL
jgi:tetratricopeptide (TPR) repeat protein